MKMEGGDCLYIWEICNVMMSEERNNNKHMFWYQERFARKRFATESR